MTAFGFIGFGAVASCLAKAMLANGAEVAAYDLLLERPEGKSKLEARRGSLEVALLPLSELIPRSEFILSTVTTDVAIQAARSGVRHLRGGQVFIDFNATSPEIKREIAALIAETPAAFVEGAVLGAIGATGANTRILLCGTRAAEAAQMLNAHGLNTAFYGEEIGRASTFKLLRSIFSKGIEALLVETLVAARRAGVEDDIWQEIVATLDELPFAEVGGNWVRTHATAHQRRWHELQQVRELLRTLSVDPLMTEAATKLFERSTRLGLADRFQVTPQQASEVTAALEALLADAKRSGGTKRKRGRQ